MAYIPCAINKMSVSCLSKSQHWHQNKRQGSFCNCPAKEAGRKTIEKRNCIVCWQHFNYWRIQLHFVDAFFRFQFHCCTQAGPRTKRNGQRESGRERWEKKYSKRKNESYERKAAPMTWRWHYCARYSMKWMWRIAKTRKRRILGGKSKRQDPPQLMPPRIVMAVQNIPQNLAGKHQN